MKSSFLRVAFLCLTFAALPVFGQFIELPTDPPPSAKELDLPTVIETISGLSVVDEASRDGANGFIKDEAAAIALGKAFYWDMQVGSDGVACGTCHYHAGADARETNQLSPGLKGEEDEGGGNRIFDMTVSGGGGPNYTLNADDFPTVSDDVVSSQGTFSATFNDVEPGDENDDCTVVSPDPLGFHVSGINVRRVEPRNTPTVINAAFNHRNFWDGRANNIFNGVDPFGQRNTAARVLEAQGKDVVRIQVAFENSSLASQSVGPPSSDLEMACAEDLITMAQRNFMKIGKKMVSLEALAEQEVHPNDSVLGSLSNSPGDGLDGKGNSGIPYSDLIKDAISNRFWDSNKLFDVDKNVIGKGSPSNTDEYTQMEANFSLIWGLAIQTYIRTLVSDDAPYDQWAEAPGGRSPVVGNTKGILTPEQMSGMNLFFTNEIGPGPTTAEKIGLRGNCSTCHQGPLFTTATFPFTEEEESGEFPEQEQLVERMRRGDGVNIAEDLFRYFTYGQGTVGSYTIDGRAGSWELPLAYPATVGGDLTLNGVPCKVTSYLTNQDRTQPAPSPGSGIPPEPPGPSDYADYSTMDAVIRVKECVPIIPGPPGPPISELEIRIIDGGENNDTADILPVIFGGLPAPCPVCYPIAAVYGDAIASGAVTGDFTIEVPTVYDTAFYNIGVRPTGEDPGVGANDPFGVPLSFTQQWIDQLLGTPAADVDAIRSLNFARVTEPFSWYGDSVFFPGGFDGYAWLTHRLVPNPEFGNDYCSLPFPPFNPAPPPFDTADQVTCEEADFNWFMPSEFTNAPQFFPPKPGRGDEAVPAYDLFAFPFPNTANEDAIVNMPKAIDGAFKVPNLRNLTLTAPYFHNGGQLTLTQVVEFYNRGGDFATENLGDLAPNIHPLDLDAVQIADLVAFLDALTDERVTCEMAPFDHPEIRIANGAVGNTTSVTESSHPHRAGQSVDNLEKIPATGAGGRLADGAPCIDEENFLP